MRRRQNKLPKVFLVKLGAIMHAAKLGAAPIFGRACVFNKTV